jgi:hypothetical protein
MSQRESDVSLKQSDDGPPWRTNRSPLVTVDLWHVPLRHVGGAVGRMALDRARLRRVDGLAFARLVGTGVPGAFAPWDADPRRWGLVAVWDEPAAARAFEGSPVASSWARIADEHFHVELRPLAARGRWSGREPFGPASRAGAPRSPDPASTPDSPAPATGQGRAGAAPDAENGPIENGQAERSTPRGKLPAPPGLVAVLTRARLAPRHAVTFWRAAPPVAADLATHVDGAGPTLALGIGEAPIGWQGTFSVWPSLAAVRAFAYQRPAHAAVVRRTGEVGWYAEELFARFAVLDGHGTVDGRDPLRPTISMVA